MSEALRMDAYYYSFDPTGEKSVDELLSAIAWAGKCYHHTEDWREEQAPRDSAHTGSTPVDWIQNAATATAAEITALRAENARLAQWTDNAQERVFQCLEKVDALRAAHEALLRRTQSLETALDQERGKALRFGIDQLGIEQRERESVELVNLRADILRYREYAQHHDECANWWSNAEGDRWVSDGRPCTCGLDALLSGRGEAPPKESPH